MTHQPWQQIWIVALSVTLLTLTTHVSAEMRFTHLLKEANQNGDGIGATVGITQDQHGFIWIAGENGVLKYDGLTTRYFFHDPTQPSLSSNYARTILVDHSGVIWVGTDLGVCYLDYRIDNFRCFGKNPSQPLGLTDETVFSLALAPDNSLYVGTGNGLNILNPARTQFKKLFYGAIGEPIHPLSSVSSLLLDGDHLWLGTSGNGYGILNLTTSEFQHHPFIAGSPNSISFPSVRNIVKDDAGRVWISTYGGGLNRISADQQQIKIYRNHPTDLNSIGSDVIWQGFQDSTGAIWFATDHGGLSRYDEDNDQFINYRHDPNDHYSISSDQVKSLYEDSSGNLWIGAFPQGVDYINRSAQFIEHWTRHAIAPKNLTNSAILSFLEDKQGHIWVGTENGLNEYNPVTASFTQYLPRKGVPGYLQAGPVLTLEQDPFDNLWIGTWSGGLHRMNLNTKQIEHIPSNSANPTGLHDQYIWDLLWDKQHQQLFLATEGDGINIYNPNTGEFKHFTHDPQNDRTISSNFVLNLLQDANGDIWIATTDNLDRFDQQTQSFVHYKNRLIQQNANPNQLHKVRFRSLTTDAYQRMWIGSQNNGIFIFDPASFTTHQIDLNRGLPSNYISSMVMDHEQQMWVTTPSGVARIDINDLSNISVFDRRDGLSGNHYNRDASLVDQRGMVYLGGIDGVSRFFPNDINNSAGVSPVHIFDFRILNQSIRPGDLGSPLKKSIFDTESLTIEHHQSMITLEYIAINYSAPNSFEYAYKLDGFDANWNYVENKRFATYTNLNQGQYTFRVKAKAENGAWPEQETRLHITVLPPFWLTYWAYSFYALVIAALVVLGIRIQTKRLELITEKSLNSELIRLNRIKDAFLANTSHELRTPLNGIIGIAESVYEEAQGIIQEHLLNKLNLIAASGKRLSNLINDILDYTKLGQNKLNIFSQTLDLYPVVDAVITLLQPLAAEKNIHLCNTVARQSPVYADENRLQQILLNLVGNGIKYTESGSVTVTAHSYQNFMEIHVIDTGVGIDRTQQEKIFDAFHQVEDNVSQNKGGTGLGLAVTKELVELHGGRIWVKSQKYSGANFGFLIPKQPAVSQATMPPKSVPPLAPKNQQVAVTPPRSSRRPDEKSAPICQAPADAEHTTILIVDDDPVNRLVLSSMLSLHHYQVVEANDGLAALAIVEQQPIDLVILDVMMPKMSGFEVCQILRKSYPIHMLPILFLTAKKVDEDVSQGFAVGANEFLTKPVSKYEILPRVANHVRLLHIYRNLSKDSSLQS